MGIKISNLPAVVAPALTDIFPVVQGGITYKETITQLQTLLGLSTVTTTGVQNQSYSYAADSGAADAYAATMSPAILNYVAGQRFDVLISNTNTTASTLNINGLGTKSILRNDGTSLVGGDLIAGMIASFEYNGTAFELINPARRLLGTTTNDSAVAGYTGEFISSQILQASAVNIPNATDTNVTSISVSAGDFDIWGNTTLIASGGSFTSVGSWISVTSATTPDISLYNSFQAAAFTIIGLNAPFVRISVPSLTTVYLSARANFGAGTATVMGGIFARRAR